MLALRTVTLLTTLATLLIGYQAFAEEQSMIEASGERLYNGIVLPEQWPPRTERPTLQPMRAPYLESPPRVIPIDLGRQLFVDDFLVDEFRTNLRRSYHKLEPYPGNPVLKADKPWEYIVDPRIPKLAAYKGPFAAAFSDGVWYDPQDMVFKMWYMGGLLNSTCYATSKDGIVWEKPELDVVPGANVVHTGDRDSSTVWLDHEEKDTQKRYKMFRFQKAPVRGLFYEYSADGIHWSKEAVKMGLCHDRTTVFYNPFRKVWVYSIKGAYPLPPQQGLTRIRSYHEGTDPITAGGWGKLQNATYWFWGDRLDKLYDFDVQFDGARPLVYCIDSVAYESLMLGLITMVRRDGDERLGRPKLNEVYAGFSRDGFHWHRPLREPIFGVSDCKGDWNWGNVQSVGGCCLVVGDRLYFYFSGRAGAGRLGKEKGCYDTDASMGLCFLRRDGFASMDAGKKEGVLVTRPVRFTGGHFFVNVDVDEGELRVEAIDEDEKPISPFTRENGIPLSVDSTLQAVTWKGAANLSGLAKRDSVRFRFYLRRGRLYSFWISRDPHGASGGYVAAGGPGFTGATDTVGDKAKVSEPGDF